MRQYYYELDLSAVMCYFTIKINDVEIFSLNVEGQIASDIPINNGILEKGNQTIEVTMFPLQGEKELHPEAYVRYKVIEYDVSSGDFQYIKQFDENFTSPVKKGIPIVKQISIFLANVDYKLNAWQNSQNLKELKLDIKKILINEYNEIVEEINSGKFQNVLNKMKNKFDNLAICMYLNKNEAQQKSNNLLSDFQEGFKAQKLLGTEIVEYSAKNKLVCLRKPNGKHTLHLINNKDEEMDLMLYFHIPNGKTELEVI